MTEQLELTDTNDFEPVQPLSPHNPLRVIWRNKMLVILGVVFGTAIGGLYYARAVPIYESSAKLLVVKKAPDSLPGSGIDPRSAFSEDYLATFQSIIRSPKVVDQAVRQANLAALPSFAGRVDPTGEIINSLKVTQELNSGRQTNVLNITCRTPIAADAPVVVEAVIASYQKFLLRYYKSVADETAKEITKARDILENKLEKKDQEYDAFKLANPFILKGKDGISIVQEHLISLEDRHSALLVQVAEIQGRLDAFEKAVKSGNHSRGELLAMISQAQARAGTERLAVTSALEEKLMTLELQEKTLQEDYGPEHPQLQAVRNQLTLLRARMERIGKLTGRR